MAICGWSDKNEWDVVCRENIGWDCPIEWYEDYWYPPIRETMVDISSQFLEYVFEAQDILSVKPAFPADKCLYHDISNYTAFALGYCISGLGNEWILDTVASETPFKMLGDGMKYLGIRGDGGGSIVNWTLRGSCNMFEGNLIEAMTLNIPPRFLQPIRKLHFELSNCKWLDSLAKCIPNFPCLKSLGFRNDSAIGCELQDGSLVKLMKALQEHKKLTSLTMPGVNIGTDDTRAVLELVQSEGCCLRELQTFHGPHLPHEDYDCKLTSQVMLYTNSLMSITVYGINYKFLDEMPAIISETISILKILAYRKPKGEPGSPFNVEKLSNIIRNNTSLKVLMLDIELDIHGIRALLQSLKANNTLEELHLSENLLSEHEQKALDLRVQLHNPYFVG